MSPKITVIGSANIDYIMQMEHLPSPGETVTDGTFAQAFEVDAVDATAAGDTFCGALALALGEGQSLPNAGRFASAASALAVTQLGAQSSIPTRQAIDAFLLSQKGTDAEGASDTRC